ncbi:macro domain-containing protein [Plesiomonas shigelloides]|uniref:macro domain-containing protein n=1 Tax=Plesiomonas shigelloides TaxID=703 RepID=UPI00057A733F|nr:macro domain-containing protein [Plesiomonas shigelloides]
MGTKLKVGLTDKTIKREFLKNVSLISAFFTIIFIFISIPESLKLWAGLSVTLFFCLLYLFLWRRYNKLTSVNIKIDGTDIAITTGDIFKQEGFKVIAFNEYFDTIVDDKIISKKSLNGIYINEYAKYSIQELDEKIENYEFEDSELIDDSAIRRGKSKRYKLGTICVIDNYLLAAFSKFDNQNKAILTMPQYLEFLINFWDNVNRVYAQESVSVPIFGSGITRFKEHKNISDEELLKIMLWTFRISEMRFKYPAKLNIIIHPDKMKTINLLEIKAIGNGL